MSSKDGARIGQKSGKRSAAWRMDWVQREWADTGIEKASTITK
jgi:hypothetical protein